MSTIKSSYKNAFTIVATTHILFFGVLAVPNFADPKIFAGASTVAITYALICVTFLGGYLLRPKQCIFAILVQLLLISFLTYLSYGQWVGYRDDALLGIVGDVLLKPTLLLNALLFLVSLLVSYSLTIK